MRFLICLAIAFMLTACTSNRASAPAPPLPSGGNLATLLQRQGAWISSSTVDYCKPSAGVKVVDTSQPVTEAFLQQMQAMGVEVIARYYGYDRNNPPPDGKSLTNWEHQKIMSPAEVALLKKYGMGSIAVFQYESHEEKTFSNWQMRSQRDAARAAMLAKQMRQPLGSYIYFTADADFVNGMAERRCQPTHNAKGQRVPGNCATEIKSYFANVSKIMRKAGYHTAVYGTGATCKMLTEAGIVNKCWLNFSEGHAGRQWGLNSPQTVLRQLTEAKTDAAAAKCGGRKLDADWILQSDFGQFRYP